MKGEEHLWGVLNDKLDTLSATNHLAEAIRVGESALEIAKRSFGAGDARLAFSYEKLGLLHEQNGNRSGAKAYLVNAHRLLARMRPADAEAVFRSSRRLGQLCNELGHTEEAIDFFEQAVAAAPQVPGLPFSDLGALLNNVALMCRKAGRGTAAEPYYLRALQIYESQLGPEHPDVASVLNNQASFIQTRSVLRRRNRFISARSPSARKYFLPATPTSPNRNAISPSFIIRGAITSGLQNFIALRSRLGRKQRPNRQRNTKSWRRTTPIFSVHSVRPAKRTRSKTGPARNDAVDCGCAGCADKSASLRQFFELTWRNWQTRTAQDRMGQPVEVRVLS